jgi:basic amino acid/polyamine antiporter, APA family
VDRDVRVLRPGCQRRCRHLVDNCTSCKQSARRTTPAVAGQPGSSCLTEARVSVPRVQQSKRDSGLVRAVGPWALAANIVTMIVGAGIFTVPRDLAAAIGVYAPLAFLGCGLGVGCIAICFAEGGTRVPTSGGVYGFVDTAFGPFVGFACGLLLLISDVLACGGVAAGLADVAASVSPASVSMLVRVAVIVCVIGGIATVNVLGVARGAGLVAVTTVLKLLPLVVFVVIGIGAVHTTNFSVTVRPDAQDLGRALILALFSLVGMETALCASGEVRNPSRTIPRALGLALVSTTLLYIAIQIVAQGILGPELAHATVPLADAMARINPSLRMLLLVGSAVSMLGWIGGDILGSPRLLFAFGRDGTLPRLFGRVHSRTHAPYVAILCYAVVASALALTGSFGELAVVSTLAMTPIYIAGCAGAWLLARRQVAQADQPLNFQWVGLATVIGIFSMLVTIALASRNEILGLLGFIVASVLLYAPQFWRTAAGATPSA